MHNSVASKAFPQKNYFAFNKYNESKIFYEVFVYNLKNNLLHMNKKNIKNQIENETWKPVIGFETYEVSDQGRLRNIKTGRVFTGTKDAFGYKHVRLVSGDGYSLRKVHRIVAEAFIENPENKPIVDHINNDKTDNRVENLRWCTYSENSRNYIESDKYVPGCKVKKIAQYDMQGNLIGTFNNTWEASAATGIQHFTIYPAAKGLLKTAGGYMWRFYSDSPEKKIEVRTDQRLHPVIRVQSDGKEKRYESVMAAAIEIKAERSKTVTGSVISVSMTIRSAAKGVTKTAYGYRWKFVDEVA